LGHDEASGVTPEDIVRFKDVRIQNGVSPKTIKDSDLAGLKAVFGWAVMNRHMSINPAEGLTIKTSKPRKVRAKGFSDKEAILVLKHAKTYKRGGEAPNLRRQNGGCRGCVPSRERVSARCSSYGNKMSDAKENIGLFT
jgi:site-specific recombinase XerD